jgi:agmatine/peptidylarginine deiminase
MDTDGMLVVQPAEVAREYLKDAPNVTVVELEIEDGWTRDWGPSVSFTLRDISSVNLPFHARAAVMIFGCGCAVHCEG